MQIQEIRPFFSSIYKINVDCFSDEITDTILKNQNKDNGKIISNRKGWQSQPFYYGDLNDVDNLIDNIIPIISKIYQETGIFKDPTLNEYWFNINKKGSYNLVHNHPCTYFSAVFYVSVPNNSGNIIFERTDQLCDWTIIDQVNERNWGSYYIEPYKNLLVIFPAYMRHFVEENVTTDEDDRRISIAFNFK